MEHKTCLGGSACPQFRVTLVGPPASHEYRGASLIRKRTPLGPYRRPMPRVLRGSYGNERFLMGEIPVYTFSQKGVALRRRLGGSACMAAVLPSYTSILGDICLWVGVPRASSALAAPLAENPLSQPTLSLSTCITIIWRCHAGCCLVHFSSPV